EDAREKVAALLGAFPDEVTFTSGATEANNLAVFGLTASWRVGGVSPPSEPVPSRGADVLSGGSRPPLALASPLEHPCVIEPLKQLEGRGFALEWLPVSPDGTVQVHPIPPETPLVSVMLANHETGAIQPVQDIARLLPPGVPLHCDAAQAVGK